MTTPSVEISKFEKAKRRCVDQYRAIASLQAAYEYAFRLVDGWETNDHVVSSALHAASVTAYCRPFSQNKTSQGNIEYPIKDLKRVKPDFDGEMHNHILILRNQMIAHSDYSWLKSTMFYQAICDDQALPLELGINVKRIRGIKSRELAERYLRHIFSCVERLSFVFDREFNDLAREVRDNPNVFKITANIDPTIAIEPLSSELKKLPPPSGEAGDVEEPEFADKIEGYRFEKLTHKRALCKNGIYAIPINGKLEELKIEIEGPEL